MLPMGAPIERLAVHCSLLSFPCGNAKQGVVTDHHRVEQFFLSGIEVIKQPQKDVRPMYERPHQITIAHVYQVV